LESLLDQSSLFLQQLVNGVTLGGVYALIAVGYTMVYGVIQLINFAHGEVYMLGAFSPTPWWPLWACRFSRRLF
jgi:branched-chain amino acid transport system permease protein